MSGEADGAAGEVPAQQAVNGLGYFCAHMEEISALLAGDAAAEQALERLRLEMRRAGDICGPLDDIHDALLRAGDALASTGIRGGCGT